jgi:hypothetical protein
VPELTIVNVYVNKILKKRFIVQHTDPKTAIENVQSLLKYEGRYIHSLMEFDAAPLELERYFPNTVPMAEVSTR